MKKTPFLLRFDASIPLKEIHKTIFNFLSFCAEREEKRTGNVLPLGITLLDSPMVFRTNPSVFDVEIEVYEFSLVTKRGMESLKLGIDIVQFFYEDDERFDMLVDNVRTTYT